MGMTAEEQSVANELQAILASPQADLAYDAIPATLSGKILNADLARELSPRYQTVMDRIKFTRATYEPARDYVYQRYMRTVRRPGGKVVIILAGGAASGKSTSIKAALKAADLVFDSNCADFEKACRLINAAKQAVWGAMVAYVHRNFRAAVEGMLTRAIENGRCIPLSCKNGPDLASLHLGAQRTFVALSEHYANDPFVNFAALRNPWTPENPQNPTGIAIKTLAPGGKRHYTCIEDLYVIQNPVVQSFLSSGQLSPELRRSLGIA